MNYLNLVRTSYKLPPPLWRPQAPVKDRTVYLRASMEVAYSVNVPEGFTWMGKDGKLHVRGGWRYILKQKLWRLRGKLEDLLPETIRGWIYAMRYYNLDDSYAQPYVMKLPPNKNAVPPHDYRIIKHFLKKRN